VFGSFVQTETYGMSTRKRQKFSGDSAEEDIIENSEDDSSAVIDNRIVFVDVGQGNCTLVNMVNAPILLVDC